MKIGMVVVDLDSLERYVASLTNVNCNGPFMTALVRRHEER
jgi:hypothetical protein